VNLLHESLIKEYERREQLADIDTRWQVVELERAQGKRPFFFKTSQFFQLLNNIRKIRVQISFEVQEPCPDGAGVR
jgi:hypothetical protein